MNTLSASIAAGETGPLITPSGSVDITNLAELREVLADSRVNGRSAPVAVQGQLGGELQALRSTGRCPRTEQNGMSVYHRIPMQFIFQTLRIGLHAYLLGGGHSGALD